MYPPVHLLPYWSTSIHFSSSDFFLIFLISSFCRRNCSLIKVKTCRSWGKPLEILSQYSWWSNQDPILAISNISLQYLCYTSLLCFDCQQAADSHHRHNYLLCFIRGYHTYMLRPLSGHFWALKMSTIKITDLSPWALQDTCQYKILKPINP